MATLVLGGAFLLRMDSLTGYITALLVGVAHLGGALRFHALSGGAGALLSRSGEKRIWGSWLSLLICLERQTEWVTHLAFCLAWCCLFAQIELTCFLRVLCGRAREVPSLVYALQNSGVGSTPVSVPLSLPSPGC